MAPSKQLLVALLLGVLVGHAHGIEGDVIAASDFRSGTQDWQLKGLGSSTGWSSDGLQSEGDVIAAIDSPSDTGRTWYYSAPKAFLGGDKSLAYNGWLVFDFGHFEYESMGLPVMDGFDVYLQAKNKKNSLGIKGVFKMDDNKLSNTYSVRLEEDFVPPNSTATWEMVNVQKVVNGRLVTKAPTQHEFITCLQTLAGIWIRGSYFKGSEASWLKNVKIIQGAVNKGGNPLGAVATLVNGSLVYDDKKTPPTASSTCCSSRTCVSNDKYEISFDRPGCMQSSDMYCCMGSDGCRRYSRYYDKSTAHDVIRQTDNNEGRAFFTPGTVNKCKGQGSGQYGAQFSSCHSVKVDWGGAAGTAGATRTDQASPAQWNTGTKNQNMGLQAIPIQKPFVKDYYMSSIPRICSPATLTVEAHGDLAEAKDNIMVYGEDDVYLGTIFAGNLTYLREGQRAYDAYGPNTDCDGTYDPNVPGTDANARLADPHHPTGNRPQYKGYRGGRNDVVTPGVQGNEDTRCRRWMPGGQQPLSLEHSESTPYVDSIAISQDRMMQYSADGQIKFTFRSVRDDSTPNSFSGTGGGGSTRFCNFGTGSGAAGDCPGAGTAGQPNENQCQGCDLDGKVIFRSIKLKFSAGVCFSKSAANDIKFTYEPRIHTAQNLNISVTYSVPSGATGQPGGDAAFSITAGADIFGLDKKLEIYDKDLNKIGDLFARESFQSLRTHTSQQSDLKINCDTTSPIVGTERCKPAENQWNMKNVLLNYTDTIRIPRETIAKLAVDGKVTLYIAANSPGNAFSLTSYGTARFSPITLAYPLMHCFMKAIKTGPNFGIFLERPMSYYFKETGFPMPAGDVTVFVAASWQQHVRYVTRHVGVAINNKFAYDGTEDGLPVMRVDKDTVGDMGSVWIYKNSDGKECCPSTHRPSAADGMHAVAAYSNCLGKSGCKDPWVSSEDECTESNPCPTAVAAAGSVAGTATVTGYLVGKTADLDATPDMYVGMKLILYAPLKTGTTTGITIGTAAAAGALCSCTGPSCTATTTAPLKITGGGGGGAICTATLSAIAPGTPDTGGIATATTCSNLGAYQWVPTVSFYPEGHPFAVTCRTTTTVFTAVLEDLATAALGVSYGGNPLKPTGTNIRTITAYDAPTFKLFVDTAFAAVPDVTNRYRISADLSEDVRTNPPSTAFSRNIRDGGTTTGSVAVQLPSSVSCKTKVFQTGAVENYNSAGTAIRLDSTASLYDTAYNSYKVRVTKDGGGYDDVAILSYAGTVSGWLSAAPVQDLAGALSFTLKALSASAVKGNALAAHATNPSASWTVTTPGDLTPALATVDDFYNGAIIEIDMDGDPSTGDDIYTRKIFDYVGSTNEVKIKIPFIRKSLLSGRAAGGGSATAIVLPIAQVPLASATGAFDLTAPNPGAGCTNGAWKLRITGGGGGGADCTATVGSGAVTGVNCGALGLFASAPTADFYPSPDGPTTCTTYPTFVAVLASSTTAAPTNTYNGMYILVDIDGYPQTENDISFTTISAWVKETRTATVVAMKGIPLVGQTTFTIVESLTNGNLDWPVYEADPAIAAGMRQTPAAVGDPGNARPNLNPSTFRIYGRDAKLSAPLTVVAGTKSTLPTTGTGDEEGSAVTALLGAAAAAGDTQVTLTAPAAGTADLYKNMRLRITEWGVTDEYTITEYTVAKVAKLSQPLLRSHTLAVAKFEILRVYEIYKDLGGNCLENVNMSVTYTYGTARTVGNDPGELSTIYSNWDRGRNQYDGTNAGRVLSPASLPDQRNVQSWVLKLAGEGYYSKLYPAEGLGSYDTNTNKAAGSLVSTCTRPEKSGVKSATTQTLGGFPAGGTVGLQVGQLIKITNFGPTSGAIGLSEQFEIVKILSITDGISVQVERAQMSTIAQEFNDATLFVYTTGFNRGQGMDEMANLHKDAFARYSASTDNAYKDLFVTVTEGAGAGQTRLIVNYHGDSRTVYVNSPWNIIPDTTSKYKIWYSAEIVSFTTAGNLAIATFPRPVKQGYLAELKWYDCSEEMPMSFLNNDWFYQTASEKRQGPNYVGDPGNPVRTGGSKSAQVRPGLPVCTGQLGMRRPKLGPPVFYPRFKMLQTQYASGVVTVGCLAAFKTDAATTCVTPRSTLRVVLDKNADTASNAYIGRKIVFTDRLGNPRCTCPDQTSTVTPHANKCAAATNPVCEFTIMQSWLGGTAATTSATGNLYTEIILDQALGFTPVTGTGCTGVCSCTADGAPACDSTAGNTACLCHPRLAVTDLYRILPAAGVPGDTTVSETGQNGEQYFMEEVDVVRYEYPELIKQHREWPHGYSYLQMKAGEDGEHVGNLFLKDYTQYSTESYYTDSITIPREMFENYVKPKPNGVEGEFPFTIKTPPGAGNIELLSMVFGYPVLKQEDASSYDSTDISTKRQSSHGPPPFFPHSAAWRGTDEHVSTPKTHPRFQTHAYTSTCGNGVLDSREGCDDANQNDGDGCSSACAVEDGWFCEIKTVASPSICRKGLVGETLLISTPF